MFDPTIFDNLKTVLEGEVYDRDLDGKLLVTDRTDFLDMATMSRSFRLEFRRQDQEETTVTLMLDASLEHLAAEILERTEIEPGCDLSIDFTLYVIDPQADAVDLIAMVREIWEGRPRVSATVRFDVDDLGDVIESSDGKPYELTLQLRFDRKIDERQLDDLDGLLNVVMDTLDACNQYATDTD